MTIESILSRLDNALAPTASEPELVSAPRHAGRRFLLGAVGSTAALVGFSTLTHASMSQPSGAYAARRMPTMSQPDAAQYQAPRSEAPTIDPNVDAAGAPNPAAVRDWTTFRARFVQADGRVVDSYNNGVSHTESQGLGMLFAVAFDDRESFDRIWGWTARHLRRPSDSLFAWRYVPGQVNPVSDTNNATDGDIYIAAALVRAAHRWGSAAHLKSGQAIARDILGLLVRNVGGRTVLLPGVDGFTAPDHTVINASYYVFPLLTDLQGACPSPTWAKLLNDGRQLVAEAQFGRWRLPPDWLQISAQTGALSLADRQPPRFSFDAVRVPLFVAWDRGNTEALQRFAAFWGRDPENAPAWVDLRTDAGAPYKPCGGIVAIATLVGSVGGRPQSGPVPAVTNRDDYYSAALILLSRMAIHETGMTTT